MTAEQIALITQELHTRVQSNFIIAVDALLNEYFELLQYMQDSEYYITQIQDALDVAESLDNTKTGGPP